MIIAPFIVSLREGIEAALIIAIMLSYLHKTGKENLKSGILGGTLLAFAASVGLAAVMALIWGAFDGPLLEVFEGSVVLIAAFLLTSMIFWMRKAGAGMASEIEQSVEVTAGKRNLSLPILAFALVLREGVELVLFTAALAIQDGYPTFIGVTLGLIVAVFAGFGIYQGSLRISLKSFFNSTSALLVLFAAGMIAYGIHELQEVGFLALGPIEVWNLNPPLLPDGGYPLLHEKGLIGGLAKALFGYNGNPSALEVFAYFGYLASISLYYFKTGVRTRPGSKAIVIRVRVVRAKGMPSETDPKDANWMMRS
ncbi:MAG: FTR1 family iron permease [Candidatus Thorarchaeota archaeon]|jgi:high-affinity iron transporter